MVLKLSVVDQSPVSAGSTPADALHNTIDLARLAERLGYTRYWIAEHHAMQSLASPAPEVLIARVQRRPLRSAWAPGESYCRITVRSRLPRPSACCTLFIPAESIWALAALPVAALSRPMLFSVLATNRDRPMTFLLN